MGINRTFAALADPIRLAIVERLAQGEATYAELCPLFPIARPGVSRHLRILEEQSLILNDGAGRFETIRRIDGRAFMEIQAWLNRLSRSTFSAPARQHPLLLANGLNDNE